MKGRDYHRKRPRNIVCKEEFKCPKDLKTNQLAFFEWIANHLGIKTKEDWYNVVKEDVIKYGGKDVLRSYDGSFVRTIMSVYPDHDWLVWKFVEYVPWGTWRDKQVQKEYMIWLKNELNITQMDDWYDVTNTQIYEKRGSALLWFFGNSPSKMIMSILNEHKWDTSKFNHKPAKFWDDMDNQKRFFDHLSNQLNIKKMEDWYRITRKQLAEKRGLGLLATKYQNSIPNMLSALVPEHPWNKWKFAHAHGFWDNVQNIKDFVGVYLAKELNITKMEDWYTVKATQIHERGGAGLLRGRYGDSPAKMITSILSEHQWDITKFNRGGKPKKDNDTIRR
eukprot:TRINITY_DN2324_c0_g1_i1.p1 TRINITY_DN2324_c0_g1~~TRINITY_DN2324_c0_g1_i1.p1  ORF type:complete len:335 (-),score=63.47 TRINITY_DN2324_c0_g1_i1:40-1044(-)